MGQTSRQSFTAPVQSGTITFSTSSTGFVDVGVSVSVTNYNATSRWRVYFKNDPADSSFFGCGSGSTTDIQGYFQIQRNGVVIYQGEVRNFQGTQGGYNFQPLTAIAYEENPPTGTNVYTVKLRTNFGGSFAQINSSILVVEQVA